jgi:diguanylate cyclase (GGDEF)-like protein/PAS domain S-box-containing protein
MKRITVALLLLGSLFAGCGESHRLHVRADPWIGYDAPRYTLAHIWRDHKPAVIGGILAVLAIVALGLLLARRNRVLAQQSRVLAETAAQQGAAKRLQGAIGEAAAKLMRASAPECDPAINELLRTAGELLNADRAYLFQVDADGLHFSNTHEWCARGVAPELASNQHVAIADTRWWWDELTNQGLVLVDDVDRLPEPAHEFRELLRRQQVRSLCGLPLLRDRISPGFIGFDMVRHGRRWREDEVLPFQVVATSLGHALQRWQAESELAASRNFLSTLFESIPTPIFYKGVDGRYQGVNRSFEVFFGADRSALTGKTAADISPMALAQVYMAQDQDLFDTGGTQRYESQVRNARGELRDVIFHKAAFSDAQGVAAGLIGTVIDVTDTKQQQRLLVLRARRDEALLELPKVAERLEETAFMQRGQELAEDLTESRIAFIHFIDEDAGTIELITWSRRTLSEYCEATYTQHYPIRDAGIWADGVRRRAAVVCNDYARYPDKQGLPEGHAALGRFISVPVIEDDRVVMLAGVGNKPRDYDTTDVETLQLIANEIWRVVQRRRSLDVLQRSANVFTHAREGILVAEPDGTIIDVNAAMTEIIGYDRDELIGQNPRLFKSSRQDARFYETLWRALNTDGFWRGELWNRRKSGEATALLLTVSVVRHADGRPKQFVALYTDINAIKEYQRRLEHGAHYDSLTDLPNRVLVAQRIRDAVARCGLDGTRLAVLYLDLDGFKEINDAHGHDRGDQVLRALAARMRVAMRDGDTVGRLGGDEFAALLTDLPDDRAVPPDIRRLLDAVVQPVQLGGQTFQVSASVGVTFYPQSAEVDEDLLLRQADHAMYQAKQGGRNRYVVFDEEDERHEAGRRRIQHEMTLGLARGELTFCYQPKVNMRTGAVLGAECLVRWDHPELGRLQPHEFLYQITEHALIRDLGRLAITNALQRLVQWQARAPHLTLSVNIHAHHLQQPDFVHWLSAQLHRHPDLPRGSLLLEVLESSALEDLTLARRVIEGCRAIGVGFSLDDFGTGYSSLTYLRDLPADELKIDQSFVRDCLDDPEDLAILEGVLGLATAFRRRVIAEGVETLAHGEILLALGCELGQGYAIARPMPADDLADWIGAWRAPEAWRNAHTIDRDSLPALFAGVEHRAWVARIERSLLEPDAAPPADGPECHFGVWLRDQGHQRYGGLRALRDIERSHARVHALARELMALRSRGDIDAAAARLCELHALRDELLRDLAALLRSPTERGERC